MNEPRDMFTAVVVAGGAGSRFDGDSPKQFASLSGRPVVMHSVSAFVSCAALEQLILVLPSSGFDEASRLLQSRELSERIVMVAGGDTRQESAWRGFEAFRQRVPEGSSLVAVHDAARPLVSRSLIERVVDAAARHGAAIPVLEMVDTLKSVDKNDRVVTTVDRAGFVRAQTPQCFRADWLESAFRSAIENGFRGTDESSLVERIGKSVQCVPGESRNLKITRRHDLSLAAWWIDQTEE